MFESEIDWGKLTANVNLDLSRFWRGETDLHPTAVGDSPAEELLDSVFAVQLRGNDPTPFHLLPINRPEGITEQALEQMEEQFVWKTRHMFTSRMREELEKSELRHENLGEILCGITDLILHEIDQVLEGVDAELYAESLADASGDVEIVFLTSITDAIVKNMDEPTLIVAKEEVEKAVDQQYISGHPEEDDLTMYVERRVAECIGIRP